MSYVRVLDLAMGIHGALSGSGDSLPDDVLQEDVDMLKKRVDEWAPTKLERCRKVEDAVRALALAVIEEATTTENKP